MNIVFVRRQLGSRDCSDSHLLPVHGTEEARPDQRQVFENCGGPGPFSARVPETSPVSVGKSVSVPEITSYFRFVPVSQMSSVGV